MARACGGSAIANQFDKGGTINTTAENVVQDRHIESHSTIIKIHHMMIFTGGKVVAVFTFSSVVQITDKFSLDTLQSIFVCNVLWAPNSAGVFQNTTHVGKIEDPYACNIIERSTRTKYKSQISVGAVGDVVYVLIESKFSVEGHAQVADSVNACYYLILKAVCMDNWVWTASEGDLKALGDVDINAIVEVILREPVQIVLQSNAVINATYFSKYLFVISIHYKLAIFKYCIYIV